MKKLTQVVIGLVLMTLIGSFPNVLSGNRAMPWPQLGGLQGSVRLVRDADSIPHIFAEDDHDAYFMLGYCHAQDRFFQMDFQRRQLSGKLAELVGPSAPEADVEFRTLGLRRAAVESLPTYSEAMRAILEAYAAGVNAFLNDPANALPVEYNQLRLTRASIPPWDAVDSLVILNGLAFQLSFFIEDEIEQTLALIAFQQVGAARGFDGTRLFFEDVYRNAPFEPARSIAESPIPSRTVATPKTEMVARRKPHERKLILGPETIRLAKQYLEVIKRIPSVRAVVSGSEHPALSNWWVLSGELTESGSPLLANDPHLSLITPAIFYEAHLIVSNDPGSGKMNVNGVTLPGVPTIILGCNERLCWGATTNPMDVTDVYQERLTLNASRLPVATVYRNQSEPLVTIPQSYRMNLIQSGSMDNVVDSGIRPLDPGGTTFIVPRRNNGPLIMVDPASSTGLSVQYTGFKATRTLETFRLWARAETLTEFKEGLEFFDVGSENWVYADVDGNIAYFTSAEMPLREDLQQLGRPDGLPPFLIRDGTGRFMNEWIPVQNRQPGQAINYEILPFEEMPQVINPTSGFIANANNDPLGLTFDNDPLNQFRPGGGVYYLWGLGYHEGGYRQGRILQLIQQAISEGRKVSIDNMMQMQADHQMIDAQIFTPYILAAFRNARAPGVAPALATLANDPRVAEAISRLGTWDYSTPTGIREGYDPGDDPTNLPEPTDQEIRNSVAATIYALWRGQFHGNTIDATLNRLGLGEHRPLTIQGLAALRHLLDNFPTNQGRGASGVNFFEVSGAPTPGASRDILILQSLRQALDLLSGSQFASAFGRSTNQDSYRWGKLHRVVFLHLLRGGFNIPTAGGFQNLSPALPGIPRAGGFQVVDASGHTGRPGSVNDLMFFDGSARRFVAEMNPAGLQGLQIIPGGQSGDPSSPFYANQIKRWMTNQYHPLLILRADVESYRMTEQRFGPVQ